METILILTEDALTAADAAHITGLHPDGPAYQVLVPADTEANVLVALVDHLALGELREALDAALGRSPKPASAFATAEEQLATSLAQLRGTGATADGEVVGDDPLPTLRAEVTRLGAREVVVLTHPHALEDTFHQDWASRAREELRVPVLHVYLGTSQLG